MQYDRPLYGTFSSELSLSGAVCARFLCSAHLCSFTIDSPSIWDIRVYRNSMSIRSCTDTKILLHISSKVTFLEIQCVCGFWIRVKCITIFCIPTRDLFLYILPLKCETCFPRFKQSLHFAGHIWVVLRECRVIKCTSAREASRRKREREAIMLGSRKNVLRSDVVFYVLRRF